jgi:ABC-type nitrate/sulfonate/bicarbonate transport system ATPase subunit
MDTIDQIPIQAAKEGAPAAKDHGAPAIAVEDLHKSFGSQKVLNGISLTVNRGETLAVLGRSGTGKSVLLRLIIGLQNPDSGAVRIHGQDITGLSLDQLGEKEPLVRWSTTNSSTVISNRRQARCATRWSRRKQASLTFRRI